MLNLVALLLEASSPLPFERIRELLPAYGQDDIAAAKRMFERDKDALRDLGIPLEVAPTDVWEVEEGYVIPKERYYLPEIHFTPEEISALFVAAATSGEDPVAGQAVMKLLSGVEGSPLSGVAGRALAVDPEPGRAHLTAVAGAIQEGHSLRFEYRTAEGETSERHLDPYGLIWRSGQWYAVGLDRDRGAIRSFRLSRIASAVADAGPGSAPPDGFRPADHVRAGPWGPGEPQGRAEVAFSPEVGWWATRDVPGSAIERTRPDGWVVASVPLVSETSLAPWVLSFGPDAEAISPAELRREVVRRLEATLAAI